jgi:hypothetical protein
MMKTSRYKINCHFYIALASKPHSLFEYFFFDKMADPLQDTLQEALQPLIPSIVTALALGGPIWYVFKKGPYRAWYLARSSKAWHAPVHSA